MKTLEKFSRSPVIENLLKKNTFKWFIIDIKYLRKYLRTKHNYFNAFTHHIRSFLINLVGLELKK